WLPPLPPRLGLDSVGEAVRLVGVGHPPHETAEPIGPVRVGHEQAQDRPAEKLTARSDLRGEGELLEPALVQARAAARVVETRLQGEGENLGEEKLRPRAEGDPLVPAAIGSAVALPLVDEDRRDCEAVVGLDEDLLGDEETLRTVEERIGVGDRRGEIAGGSGPVLDSKDLKAAVPFEGLVPQADRVSGAARDHVAHRGGATPAGGQVEPETQRPAGRLDVVETQIQVAPGVIAVLRRDVGSGAGEVRGGDAADSDVKVFETPAVTAHVQRVEIVDLDVLAAVVPLARPELEIRLTIEEVAGANE